MEKVSLNTNVKTFQDVQRALDELKKTIDIISDNQNPLLNQMKLRKKVKLVLLELLKIVLMIVHLK